MPFGCRKLTTSTSARVTGHSRNSVNRGDCHAIWGHTRINPAKASQIHANSEIERTVSAFDGTSSYFLCILRELAFFVSTASEGPRIGRLRNNAFKSLINVDLTLPRTMNVAPAGGKSSADP